MFCRGGCVSGKKKGVIKKKGYRYLYDNKYLYPYFSCNKARLSAEEKVRQKGNNLWEHNKHSQPKYLDSNERKYSFVDIAHGIFRWSNTLEVKKRIFLGTYILSAGYYEAYYAKAQKIRNLIKSEVKQYTKDNSVLVSPTALLTA